MTGKRSVLVVLFISQPFLVDAKDLPYPREVQHFIDRREQCDHWRGELPDPDDRVRMKEVIRNANRYCAGTDKELRRLKSKYSKDKPVMKRLSAYEGNIEEDGA